MHRPYSSGFENNFYTAVIGAIRLISLLNLNDEVILLRRQQLLKVGLKAEVVPDSK